MRFITHPRFRDVAMEVISVRQYKSGFYDLKFYWIYPTLRGHNNVRIFSTPSKLRVSTDKYKEFRGL